MLKFNFLIIVIIVNFNTFTKNQNEVNNGI